MLIPMTADFNDCWFVQFWFKEITLVADCQLQYTLIFPENYVMAANKLEHIFWILIKGYVCK